MIRRLGDVLRMWWCRYRQRFGGFLALFALGLQLVSFAHIHPEGIGASSAIAGGVSFTRLSADIPGSPTAPSDHGARHVCDICISIGLLGSALSGQAPVFSTPAVPHAAAMPAVSEFLLSLVRFISFRTRAPPVV